MEVGLHEMEGLYPRDTKIKMFEDLGILERHCKLLGPGYTFCALAPGAADPLASAIEFFREDFEAHINDGKCPWG